MGILDVIFPKVCFGCHKEGVYLCGDCLEEERIVGQNFSRRNTPCLDGLVTLFRYRGGVRKAILALKYKFASDIAKELGVHAATALKSRSFVKGKKILIPIPVFKSRANWRGFNQAEEIARYLGKALGWEFRKDILLKAKPTAPQTGLSGRQRIENLKESFGVNPKAPISGFPNIILFDDVWTTGSTLIEACRTLKEKGAKNVWGITFARD